MGYNILEVSEVWHWEDRSSQLFEGYVNTFLKSKMEASGWPDECVTAAKKRAYLDHIQQSEGKYTNIKWNKSINICEEKV